MRRALRRARSQTTEDTATHPGRCGPTPSRLRDRERSQHGRAFDDLLNGDRDRGAALLDQGQLGGCSEYDWPKRSRLTDVYLFAPRHNSESEYPSPTGDPSVAAGRGV